MAADPPEERGLVMLTVHTRAALAVAFVIISICAPAAFAQSGNGTVVGQVIDKDGTALPGVTLTIRKCKCSSCGDSGCECCPAAITVVSDAKGNFSVPVAAGTYDVVAEMSGSTASASVTVAPGQSATVTLTLSVSRHWSGIDPTA
jgi:hypothetical protein